MTFKSSEVMTISHYTLIHATYTYGGIFSQHRRSMSRHHPFYYKSNTIRVVAWVQWVLRSTVKVHWRDLARGTDKRLIQLQPWVFQSICWIIELPTGTRTTQIFTFFPYKEECERRKYLARWLCAMRVVILLLSISFYHSCMFLSHWRVHMGFPGAWAIFPGAEPTEQPRRDPGGG